MNHEQKNSIQEAVLAKIRAGAVRRRPRAYFILRIIATLVVSALLLMFSALLISFILFSLHESGEQFLLGFGLRGIEVFLSLFPWLYLLISIALLFILEWLLFGFSFVYRTPLLTIFVSIVGASLVLGIIFSLTPLHSALLNAADNDRLPVVGGVYEHIFTPHEDQGISKGRVISLEKDSFVIAHDDHDHDRDDGTFTIFVSPNSNISLPQVGDEVVVFGQPENGFIEARHIQVLPPVPTLK